MAGTMDDDTEGQAAFVHTQEALPQLEVPGAADRKGIRWRPWIRPRRKASQCPWDQPFRASARKRFRML